MSDSVYQRLGGENLTEALSASRDDLIDAVGDTDVSGAPVDEVTTEPDERTGETSVDESGDAAGIVGAEQPEEIRGDPDGGGGGGSW